jgi:hypothetical protein
MTGGYDTASKITYSLAHDAANKYGRPNYWLRYLAPSPAATLITDTPNTECQNIWDVGGPHLAPITEPTQSVLGQDYASGQSHAQTFANALVNLWNDVTPLITPTNGVLYSWLGQENTTHLSQGFWNGWAAYINTFNFAGLGEILYASLYCTPHSDDSCAVTNSATGNSTCFALWSPEPQRCGNNLNNPPSYGPTGCADTPTNLWQFAEEGACGLTVNVDMDVSNLNYVDYCFYLSRRP